MSIECRYNQCPRSSGAQCIYTAIVGADFPICRLGSAQCIGLSTSKFPWSTVKGLCCFESRLVRSANPDESGPALGTESRFIGAVGNRDNDFRNQSA